MIDTNAIDLDHRSRVNNRLVNDRTTFNRTTCACDGYNACGKTCSGGLLIYLNGSCRGNFRNFRNSLSGHVVVKTGKHRNPVRHASLYNIYSEGRKKIQRARGKTKTSGQIIISRNSRLKGEE